MKNKEIENIINKTLTDLKATSIVSLDVSKVSSIADTFIIATPRSTKNSAAISNKIVEVTKDIFKSKPNVTRDTNDNWIVIDFGDIIIHLMTNETREYYKLETLWNINSASNI